VAHRLSDGRGREEREAESRSENGRAQHHERKIKPESLNRLKMKTLKLL